MDKTKYQENKTIKKQSNIKKKVPANDPKEKLIIVGVYGLCIFVIIIGILLAIRYFMKQGTDKNGETTTEKKEEIIIPELSGVASAYPDLPITEAFLSVNRYSRPGIPLSSSPQYIVIHYTANPGSTGWDNRNYFENLKDSEETFASAQFVVGLDGQIIQCVPCNEMSYCSNSYNEFCISIEMCHPDDTGNFNDATYNNCVYLVAHLMNYYHLDMDRLIRHYDVTGKNCPKYFVEHDDRWQAFKGFVEQYRQEFAQSDEAFYNQKLVEWENREQQAGTDDSMSNESVNTEE